MLSIIFMQFAPILSTNHFLLMDFFFFFLPKLMFWGFCVFTDVVAGEL